MKKIFALTLALASAAARRRRTDESARASAERAAEKRILLLRRLAGRNGDRGGHRRGKSQNSPHAVQI